MAVAGCPSRRRKGGALVYTAIVLFVLVGLQAHEAVRGLSSVSLLRALVDIVVVTAVVIGVRLIWQFTVVYIIGR